MESVAKKVPVKKAKAEGHGFRPLREVLKRAPLFPLATVREAAGKTQVEVAKTLGKEQSTISRLENGGDFLASTIEAYAKALGGESEISIRIGRHTYRVR